MVPYYEVFWMTAMPKFEHILFPVGQNSGPISFSYGISSGQDAQAVPQKVMAVVENLVILFLAQGTGFGAVPPF